MQIKLATAALAFLAVGACSKHQESQAPPEKAQPPTNRIAVPETVRRNLGIDFVKVERRKIAQTLRFPGHFELLPTARHELRTPLHGRITLHVTPLQEVKANDLVYRIDSPGWRQLQRELGEISTQIRIQDARLAAMQPLIAAHRVHEETLRQAVDMLEARERSVVETQTSVGGQARELTEARAQLAQARAELAEAAEKRAETDANLAEVQAQLAAGRDRFQLALDAAAAITSLTRDQLVAEAPDSADKVPGWRTLAAIEIRAGIDGVVDQLPAASGAWVDEGQLVASVTDLRQVRFRARALQSDLSRLRAGLSAVAIPASTTNGTDERVPGTLLLGSNADPSQRTIELFLQPSALAAWARPGVAGFLEVTTAETGDAVLAIPRRATLQDGLERVLFRRDPKDPDKVIRMEADLGLDDGRWVEVKSGLTDGDQVVLSGAYELMLASSGSAPKAGHFHSDGTYHEGEHK